MYQSDTHTLLLKPRMDYHHKVPQPEPREPSAAQNVTVVLTCKQCGAVNKAEAVACCFCDARLAQKTKEIPVSERLQTEGNLAVAPDWRTEVATRMRAYRARHHQLDPDPSQPELAFDDDPEDNEPSPPQVSPRAAEPQPPAQSSQPRASTDRPGRLEQAGPAKVANRTESAERSRRANQVERLDIDVAQPAFDFSVGTHWDAAERDAAGRIDGRTDLHSRSQEPAEFPALPVASLAERRRAALLDAALLLFAYGGFLALFAALGGRLALTKLAVSVVAATLILFYAQYVALFTFFGGSTPGMMLRHLRVVSFDGFDPTPSQLFWRSFGYLVSAGTLSFGFLSALWDEHHLCWHDRISQTYLVSTDAHRDTDDSEDSSDSEEPLR